MQRRLLSFAVDRCSTSFVDCEAQHVEFIAAESWDTRLRIISRR